MAERLNKVYAEGLTKFQTRGRSTSALPSANVDTLLSKYSASKDILGNGPASKRMDIDRYAAGLGRVEPGSGVGAGRGVDISSKITRTEKEIMSRSTDRFLGKGTGVYEERKLGGMDYGNEYQGRGRTDSYNLPVSEHRGGMDIYERLAKYEVGGRMDKYDIGGTDPYSKYSEHTPAYQNLDYMRKQLDLKDFQNDYGLRDKGYPTGYPTTQPTGYPTGYPFDAGLYRNPKPTDRFTTGLQPEYNPRSLLKQLQDEPKKDANIGREFGKQLNRDYSREISRGLGGAGLDKELLMKDYGRTGYSKDINKTYLKDYSAFGKEAGLGRMKASDLGKNIGMRDYEKTIDTDKYERYENLRANMYGENAPGVTKKDLLTGYRQSLRGNY